MTEPTGPDLALAVATVMDGQGVVVKPVLPRIKWRPDLPGADFDEALEWAMKHIPGFGVSRSAQDGYHAHWTEVKGAGLPFAVKAHDHRTAVCRGIVAWGASERS